MNAPVDTPRLARHARDIRDNAAHTVADGARHVEQYAVGAKTHPTA
jgi:hypothetical protein